MREGIWERKVNRKAVLHWCVLDMRRCIFVQKMPSHEAEMTVYRHGEIKKLTSGRDYIKIPSVTKM